MLGSTRPETLCVNVPVLPEVFTSVTVIDTPGCALPVCCFMLGYSAEHTRDLTSSGLLVPARTPFCRSSVNSSATSFASESPPLDEPFDGVVGFEPFVGEFVFVLVSVDAV
ncbi:hypothetical protein UK23_34365 [Lentzea aerocolonigenes]|uniref:Uncharacterized protein n=1 Tax=Lentzea aerocolonigenes TaxID=68170 RepID=A0A0F0GII6_LENAE|nr:hypothetical protein UK23_34365 [Lentzea aerocolonigenes]